MAYPRSLLTQSQMRDRVRGDIGMRANNLLTDGDINQWAIYAQSYLAMKTRWYRTDTLMDAVANQREYPLPVGTIGIEEVLYNADGGTDGLPLYQVIERDLSNFQYQWRRSTAGTPLYYYVRGNSAFDLYPTPGTAIASAIHVYFSATPPAPASDSDFYYVPYGCEEAIVTYCKMRASEKDASGEGQHRLALYQRLWGMWLTDVERQVEAIAEGESTIMGGDQPGDSGLIRRVYGFDPSIPIPAPS